LIWEICFSDGEAANLESGDIALVSAPADLDSGDIARLWAAARGS
jgi:hypothetical protein